MQEEILRLRAEGKTYKEICEITGASKSTVSYYCSEGQREKTAARRIKRRQDVIVGKTEAFKYNKKGLGNKYTQFKIRSGKTYDFSLDDVKEKAKGNPTCYLSGRMIDYADPSSYHFDHILPVARGGDNSLENLGIATQEANQAKGDLTLEEFLELCYDVLKHNGRI